MYFLAGNAAGFDKTITVQDTAGNGIGTLSIGDILLSGGKLYSLGLDSDGKLSLDVTGGTAALLTNVVGSNPSSLTIANGTYNSESTFLNGVQTVIESGMSSTLSVCGGMNSNNGFASLTNFGSQGATKDISLTINGATIKNVYGGSRVNSGYFNHYGNVDLTINGGTFSGYVGGGVRQNRSSITQPAFATLVGNVNLTITSGSFNYVYGGNIAAGKQVSGFTCINGNVTTTLNVGTGNSIEIGETIYAGSYGNGAISGNVKIQISGGGTIAVQKEIWGGCGGDYYVVRDGQRVFESSIAEASDRLLSFTGFTGELTSQKIRGFKSIEFVKDGGTASSFVLAGDSYNLSDFENWTFEYGCDVHDADFKNNFEGDTLKQKGLDLATLGSMSEDWTLISAGSGASGLEFRGFSGISHVSLVNGNNSVEAELSEDETFWYWGDTEENAVGKLYVSGNNMILTNNLA